MEQTINKQANSNTRDSDFVKSLNISRSLSLGLGLVLNSKPYLAVELAFIFLGVPIIFFFGLIPFPELLALFIIMIVCSIWLFGFAREKSYRFSLKLSRLALKSVLVRFAYAAVVLTTIFLLLEPDQFLILILNDPWIWALAIIAYPILSVIPQELIYRVFFFKRYRKLFTNKTLFIHVNALAFGFLHIVYGNYPAIFLTYAAGYLFARTYLQTRSFWAVCLEHILYGILIFTIGMGQYFYNGVE